MRPIILALVATVALAATTLGQNSCDPEKDKNCTIEGALNFYRGEALVADVAAPIAEEVKNTNRATTIPEGFAGRFHNSYQDFLNLLSLGVNDVKEEDDGQAIVIRFNPVRHGSHLLGVALTFSQPKVGDVVKSAIPEDVRDATVKLLEKQLGDTDDLTWSASYSYASRHCDEERDGASMCWGRNPETYRDLIGAMLPAPTPDAQTVADLFQKLANEQFPTVNTILDTVPVSTALNPAVTIAELKAVAEAEKASIAPAREIVKALYLDILPTLIDNQPQITGSANWRSPGRLGGAESKSFTLEVHSGRENLNTLRAECRKSTDLGSCMAGRLQALGRKGISTDKYVATLTYKSNDAYSLTDLRLDPPVPGFESADAPSSSEVSVKVQAGRQIGTEVMGEPMRADLSFEGIRTSKNELRTANRWVGRLTVSVPFGEKMTIPVSITYANKPEFLGEQKDQIGAHFGISYRLPELFGKAK